MFELSLSERGAIVPLCENAREVLVRSAMEGAMGRVWADKLENPNFCIIKVGNFSYLLGLPPTGKRSLALWTVLSLECNRDFITPENTAWEVWLEDNIKSVYRKLSRYSIIHPKDGFDKNLLKEYIAALPQGYKIKKINSKAYKKALENDWSFDFVGNFENEEKFLEYGLGYLVYQDKELVSGCSAYGYSRGMMEVEVATSPEHRRKGLALAAAAKFILDCISNDIYPHWDAANLASVALAKKLGYEFGKEYKVFQIDSEA